MIFDAKTLARGWLAVAVASSADKDRPQLHRTVLIEQFAQGLRLVATDSYILLHAWVPNIEHDLDPEPDFFDETPIATAVAMDPHSRAKSFFTHVLALAQQAEKKDLAPVEVRVQLGVTDHDADRDSLPGMEATYVILELPDAERLKLAVYDGAYPNWQALSQGFASTSTDTIALSPSIVGRLGKLGSILPGSMLGFSWAGPLKAARVELVGSDVTVEGLVMPCRWDVERNVPHDTPNDEESTGDLPNQVVVEDGQPAPESGEGAPALSVNGVEVDAEGASPVPPSNVTDDGEVIDLPADGEVRVALSKRIAHLSSDGANAYVTWAWAAKVPTSMNKLTVSQAAKVEEWLSAQPGSAFVEPVAV